MKLISRNLDLYCELGPTVHEIGPKIPKDLKRQIHNRLDLLSLRAPAISSTRLTLLNQNKHIKGVLTITGAGREFKSVFLGENVMEVYEELEKAVDAQLMEWKQTRFAHHHAEIKLENDHAV